MVQAIVAISSVLAAVGGIVLIFLKVRLARQGKVSQSAKTALELGQEGKANALEFQDALAKGDQDAVEKLDDTVDRDVDALLRLREKSRKTPQ